MSSSPPKNYGTHGVSEKMRIFIVLDATDMCKSNNGFSLLDEKQFKLDLFAGCCFAGFAILGDRHRYKNPTA
jgi:hypothetical protein